MAATNYILITGSTGGFSGKLRQWIDALITVKNLGNELKDTMAQASGDGAGALAVAMGFANDQQGQDNAAAADAAISSCVTDINNSAAVTNAIARFFV